MSNWYGRDGKMIVNDKLSEIGSPKWSKAMKKVEKMLVDRKYKVVRQSYLWWGGWLSTVWLGLDHSFVMSKHKPLIFESMLFFKGRSELDMVRYSTEKEAYQGHWKLYLKWSNPIRVIRELLINRKG